MPTHSVAVPDVEAAAIDAVMSRVRTVAPIRLGAGDSVGARRSSFPRTAIAPRLRRHGNPELSSACRWAASLARAASFSGDRQAKGRGIAENERIGR
jgi:hypothetical protein